MLAAITFKRVDWFCVILASAMPGVTVLLERTGVQ